MQRIPVATQRADADSMIGQNLLEFGERRRILKHRELAMSIADIVSGGQFHRIDMKLCKFFRTAG